MRIAEDPPRDCACCEPPRECTERNAGHLDSPSLVLDDRATASCARASPSGEPLHSEKSTILIELRIFHSRLFSRLFVNLVDTDLGVGY